MKKNKILFIFLYMAMRVGAQGLPDVIPPSPIAQQFHRYGDYPISHATGVPNINIPLYTIEIGDIKFPISLSYHASGRKVKDEPGNLGFGWTMLTAGRVTHNVEGEIHECAKNNIPENFLYDVNYIRQFLPNVDDPTPIDGKLDYFSYGVNNVQGKFIIWDEVKQVAGDEPHKILINGSSDYDCLTEEEIKYCEIFDQNGIKYRFGLDPDGVTEATEGEFSTGNGYSLLLTNVTSSDLSHNIHFKYGTWFKTYSSISQHSIYADYNYDQECIYDPANGCQQAMPHVNTWNETQYFLLDYKYTPISEIEFNNGKILFEYYSDHKIKKISVYHNTNQIKAYEFIYYHNLLIEIKNLDKNNAPVNSYKFKYTKQDEIIPINNYAMDFWGYYNGKGWNQNLIHDWESEGPLQHHSLYVEEGKADREADEYYMKWYNIEEIIYPTGGSTKFYFSSHKYTSFFGGVKDAGGLKIDWIKNYNENGELVSSKFYDYMGSGTMAVEPLPQLYKEKFTHVFSISACNSSSCSSENYCDRVQYSSNPSVSLTPSGSSVVYNKCKEISKDNSGNTIGNTIYEYSSPNNGLDVLENSISGDDFYEKDRYFISHDSKLIKKKIYDNTGNLVESIEYNYNSYNNGSFHGLIVKPATIYGSSEFYCGQNMNVAADLNFDYTYNGPECSDISLDNIFASYKYGHYYIHYGMYAITSTINVTNIQNGDINTGIKTTTEYEYSNPVHLQPTKVTTTNSKNESLITYYKYPSDAATIGGLTSTQITALNSMAAQNRVASVIEEKQYKGTTKLSTNLTTYKDFGSGKIYPETVKASTGTNALETRVEYTSYDSYGNLSNVKKTGDIPSYFYWSYNKSYPVVKALDAYSASFDSYVGGCASSTGISTTDWVSDPVSQSTQWQNFNNCIRGISSSTQVYTYTYKPLVGMTSETGPDGITTYYEYDSFGRLERVLDQNLNEIQKYVYHYKE